LVVDAADRTVCSRAVIFLGGVCVAARVCREAGRAMVRWRRWR
jgi:hypothetical protein